MLFSKLTQVLGDGDEIQFTVRKNQEAFTATLALADGRTVTHTADDPGALELGLLLGLEGGMLRAALQSEITDRLSSMSDTERNEHTLLLSSTISQIVSAPQQPAPPPPSPPRGKTKTATTDTGPDKASKRRGRKPKAAKANDQSVAAAAATAATVAEATPVPPAKPATTRRGRGRKSSKTTPVKAASEPDHPAGPIDLLTDVPVAKTPSHPDRSEGTVEQSQPVGASSVATADPTVTRAFSSAFESLGIPRRGRI